MKLTEEQKAKIADLKARLPKDWVARFLTICQEELGMSYSRMNAYHILNGCREDHHGWKVIEGIARRHQEALERVS